MQSGESHIQERHYHCALWQVPGLGQHGEGALSPELSRARSALLTIHAGESARQGVASESGRPELHFPLAFTIVQPQMRYLTSVNLNSCGCKMEK